MPIGSSLPGSYNYVRNSVKVVIDAYSGKMTFYDVDPKDPILQAYEAAFPNMFTPLSKMSPGLQAHLRYPEDIFSIQSAIYGRYHLTIAAAVLRRQQRVAALADGRRRARSPRPCRSVNTYNSQGQLVVDQPGPHGAPVSGHALPGFHVAGVHHHGGLRAGDRRSNTSASRTSTSRAFMMGDSDPGRYGQLTCTRLRRARSVRPTLMPRSGRRHRVEGHHPAGPERLRGVARQYPDGADR